MTEMTEGSSSSQNSAKRSNRAWGGDKVAFEFPETTDEDEIRAQNALDKIVEEERELKRNAKAEIERVKELKIKMVEMLAKLPEIQKLRKPGGALSTDAERQVQENAQQFTGRDQKRFIKLAAKVVKTTADEDGDIEVKKILHTFDKSNGRHTGWEFERIKERAAREAGLEYREFEDGEEGLLAEVTFNDERIAKKNGEDDVYVQRGWEDEDDDSRRRKEYVKDQNDVTTRRYVTRAISYYQVAQMIGFNWERTVSDFVEAERENPGHYPRGDGKSFGNQDNMFDLTRAAVVDPTKWIDGHNDDHVYEPSSGNADRLGHTGMPGYRLQSDATRESEMDINERASMQVRNGSGDDQTMLSTASIQMPVGGRTTKVVRGNKGERFDQSPETVAVLEIDLAKAIAEGVAFVNQHSADSHEHKIAYDRHEQKENPDGSKEKLEAVKRDAEGELDEYIYSGRKNREVTITEVTNSIIARVNFEHGTKATYFDEPFPFEAGWIPWSPEVEEKLKKFFRQEVLKKARDLAEEDKKKLKGLK